MTTLVCLVALVAAGGVAWWWQRRWRRRAALLTDFAAAMAAADGPPALPPLGGALGALRAALVLAARQQRDRFDAVRAEQRRLQEVLGGMVEGVVLIDAQGTVLFSNRRAEALLDLRAGEGYVGRPLIEMTRHPDLQQLMRRVVAEGGLGSASALEIELDGASQHVLQVTATPLPGGPGACILVFHDVSQLKRLERSRRDFVANVSHELRTPLAAIAGYTETLLGGALDEPERARRYLGIVARHTERLGRLVDDLLVLSDLELGRAELQRGPLRAEAVVEATFEVLGGKAALGGVALEQDIAAGTAALDADADRLEQALVNLVDNAIKYTPPGGRVTVHVRLLPPDAVPEAFRRAGAGFVEIAVEDTGVGIAPDDLPRLTERFYRVDKARSRELGGTGLGLAIVKHIVHAHGGWMHIDSELGRGTTVRVYVPQCDASP